MEREYSQYVYVMLHELGFVKIGIAKNPRQRLSDVQVSCPFEVKLINTANPHDAAAVEEFLHHRYRKYHMRGEWFDIPFEDRYFEIPTHIDDAGNPDVPLKVPGQRDMDNEWGELLENVVVAMKAKSKYITPAVRDLREQWQELRDRPGLDHVEPDDPTPPADVEDVDDDAAKGRARCSQCGHFFDRDEGACPLCDSDDFFGPPAD